MVKIIKKMGKWQNDVVKILLYYEKCPNPSCSTGIVHYPLDLNKPYCPDCCAELIGGTISNSVQCRVNYYLDCKKPLGLGVVAV